MNFKGAFLTVGGWTLVSRFAGFARDLLAANVMGAGLAADAFFIALRLPNLFRRLFAEGAFTIAFVPLFTGALQNGRDEAKRFAEQALSMLMVILVPFTLLMMVGMPWIMQIITPGFTDDPTKFALAVDLSIITFPYLMLISLAALMGSVLNALGHFGPYAAAPIAFNLTQIVALLFWPGDVESAYALSWAVTVSGAVQLVWLMVSLHKRGWSLRLIRPRLTPGIKRLFKLIGPSALGAGVMQVNIFIDMVLASLLPVGAISYLAYADRFYQLPIGVIGIALGTAMLPLLSAAVHSATPEKAITEQNRALEFALFLSVPAAVGLIIIPDAILGVLYQRGAFTQEATIATAWALAAYSLSIPAYVAQKVITAAFYAREDTKTPFTVSLRTVLINVAISVVMIFTLKHTGHDDIAYIGLALATSATAWVNVLWLTAILHKKGHFVPDTLLRTRLIKIGLCAAVMAVLLEIGYLLLKPMLQHSTLVGLVALAVLIGGAGVVYLLGCHFTKVQDLREIKGVLRRRKKLPAAENAPPTLPMD